MTNFYIIFTIKSKKKIYKKYKLPYFINLIM